MTPDLTHLDAAPDRGPGFDPSRIADPRYFGEHRLAPHSDHRWFATADEASSGLSSFE